ncbi:MAG: AIR carboxylase family protein [Candidatus Bathyarchaeota archaeon]|nr:AIR carboxylase family protein [Candidatus Bathyarchaeota archaeon]
MTRQRIVVLMGSKSDVRFAEEIGGFLAREGFTVEVEYNVSSAHRTPDILLGKLKEYEETGDRIVYVTVAGLSDALSGVVAGFSKYPVVACPPDIERSGWAKAFSSVMTPRGVPVLLASRPENAALAAVRILALADPALRGEIDGYMERKRKEVILADRETVCENG